MLFNGHSSPPLYGISIPSIILNLLMLLLLAQSAGAHQLFKNTVKSSEEHNLEQAAAVGTGPGAQ